jgi:uncharacterized membrane protein
MSTKFENLVVTKSAVYMEMRLVITIKKALPLSYLSLIIFCISEGLNLKNAWNFFQTSLKVLKSN